MGTHIHTLVKQNADAIRGKTAIRIVVGDQARDVLKLPAGLNTASSTILAALRSGSIAGRATASSNSNLLVLGPGVIDLPAAPLVVLAKRFDLVLPAEVADADARLDGAEHIPGLHLEELLLHDLVPMFLEQPGQLLFVESGPVGSY